MPQLFLECSFHVNSLAPVTQKPVDHTTHEGTYVACDPINPDKVQVFGTDQSWSSGSSRIQCTSSVRQLKFQDQKNYMELYDVPF